MAEPCAVIGVGQTQHDTKRIDVSQVGLVREAAQRALEDAELDWKDIDALVIGKAPDLFEGVMMPELFLADALGGAGKPMLRVHTAGSVGGSTAIVAASLIQAGRPPARAHRRLREAEREQRDVGALDPGALPAGRGGGGRRLLRAADPRLHPARECARGHRHPGGAQGPPERAQESLRARQTPGHHVRADREVADAVGSDPLPRDLPVLGRRLRDGALERGRRPARAAQARLGARHCDAYGAHHVRGPRPGEPAGRKGLREGAVPEGGDQRSRAKRSTAPRSTCPSAGSSRCGWRTWASRPRARAGR